MDKVRRETLFFYGLLFAFIFSLYRMTLLTFEGKKFYADGTRCEGEFNYGKLNGYGQKREIIYGLLLVYILFYQKHYLLLKPNTLMLTE